MGPRSHFTNEHFGNVAYADLSKSCLPQTARLRAEVLASSPTSVAPLSVDAKTAIPYSDLVAWKSGGLLKSQGLDPEHLEKYLSKDEVQSVLGPDFSVLPKWKRDVAKKKAGLF